MRSWFTRIISWTSYHAVKTDEEHIIPRREDNCACEDTEENIRQRFPKSLPRTLLVLSLLVLVGILFNQSAKLRLLPACQDTFTEESRQSSSNETALSPVGLSE